MEDLIAWGFKVVWWFFFAYWVWSSRSVKRASRTEPALIQFWSYWAPLFIAVVLMSIGRGFEDSVLAVRFVPRALWVKEVGLAFAAAGVFLACWSRHLLGRNWSSVVQLKQDHELVVRGPYRYIRHPIYTGLLLAFAGSALRVGNWFGLLAFAIVLASFWRKLRLEERWLADQFGSSYLAYVERTKALVPGLI